jgi:hypothetical protein
MADEGAVKEILLMSLGFLANCAPIVSGVVIIGLSLFAYSTAKPALRLLLFLAGILMVAGGLISAWDRTNWHSVARTTGAHADSRD